MSLTWLYEVVNSIFEIIILLTYYVIVASNIRIKSKRIKEQLNVKRQNDASMQYGAFFVKVGRKLYVFQMIDNK